MRPKTDLHTASNCIKIFFSRCSIVRDIQTRRKLVANRNVVATTFSDFLLMGESLICNTDFVHISISRWQFFSFIHNSNELNATSTIESSIKLGVSWWNEKSALLKVYPWGELNVFSVRINFTERDFCAISRVHAIFMFYKIVFHSSLRVEKYYYNPFLHNVIIIFISMLHVMLSWNFVQLFDQDV